MEAENNKSINIPPLIPVSVRSHFKNKTFLFTATFLILILSSALFIFLKISKEQFASYKSDFTDLYAALDKQDSAYDVNKDGAVTEEDVNSIIKRRPTPTPVVFEAPAAGGTEVQSIPEETKASGGEPILPSMRGASSDPYTGSVTASYEFDLAKGVAGLIPPLSLTYSSGTVDDLYTGTYTKWRNDSSHSYQRQAGIVGLCWTLNGISSITRNTQGTPETEADDTFIITSGAGSANLIFESGTGWNENGYSFWRTVPNIKMKVTRNQICKSYVTEWQNPRYICRAQWIAIDSNGTKYIFGLPVVDDWWRTNDPDANDYNLFLQGDGNSWFPLYNDGEGKIIGASAWFLNGGGTNYWGGLHSSTYEWLLTKTISVFRDITPQPEIDYLYDFEIGTYTKGDQTKSYVRAVYPYRISYYPQQIDFTTEARWDYKIHQGELSNPDQPQTATKRIKKIIVSTDGQAIRSYVLNYHYAYDITKHNDLNGNSILDNENEVKSGGAIHSLLDSVTPYSGNQD
jgi:hypothetical protein